MSKPVVVGVSDKQPNVVAFAIREARATNSPLRVVHATGVPPQTAGFYGSAHVVEELRRSGRPVLDAAEQLIRRAAPGLDANYILSDETPVRALEHAAEGARLIVLGSDKVPWFDRLVHSRIAGYMALHAACPVIVVPSDAADRSTGDLVLTLDGDTPAEGPVRLAFEQAAARGAALHVLHVTAPDTMTYEADQVRSIISEVLSGWRESYPDVRVMTAFSIGDPTDAIVRATEDAALVIVGRPHEHHLPVSVTHPLATEVLRHAHCAVAVVPATYEG